jgi:hypothetical protein
MSFKESFRLRADYEKLSGLAIKDDKDAYIRWLESEIVRLESKNPTRVVGKEHP